MAKELTLEQYGRVKDGEFNGDADLENALSADQADVASETAAAFGVGYQIGAVEIPPLTIGIIPLLEAIDSPFLREDIDDFGLTDIINTVFVMAHGINAARPAMALKRRRMALDKHRLTAETKPEIYPAYLAAVDAVEAEWADFESAALLFWDTVGVIDLPEVAKTIVRAFNDAFSGYGAIPGDAGSEKKTRSVT